ncbi:hypothetical protein PsYK624_000810 [Phanerochaete sordida]|uniref:Uncharacterized protein n=1 Tax=Phanerochaete sordida TaxID=48140 RepID=A0A9P3FVT1_9APHY|nr:hypothetical protein PsYK624_000810 [Phanerochaete sordida]
MLRDSLFAPYIVLAAGLANALPMVLPAAGVDVARSPEYEFVLVAKRSPSGGNSGQILAHKIHYIAGNTGADSTTDIAI